MSFDYDRSAATALRLLNRFGATATLTRAGTPTGPAYDPTPGTPTTWTASAARIGMEIKDREGGLVKAGDVQFLVESAAAPMIGDTLALAGESVYRIVALAPVSPAGTVVVWEAWGRR